MKKRVILGLSGGVDSSVAAARLLEEGYEVIGVFMRNWDSATNNDFLGNPDFNSDVCPQEKDYQDAMKTEDYVTLSKYLYRVQSLSTKDYFFRHHLETTVDDKYNGEKNSALSVKMGKMIRTKSLGALVKLNPHKVHVNVIGKIREI